MPIPDHVAEFRCTCAINLLFALYSEETGSVHIQTGKHRTDQNYVITLRTGTLLAHCRACHAWQELYYDDESKSIRQRQCVESIPAIKCRECPTDSMGEFADTGSESAEREAAFRLGALSAEDARNNRIRRRTYANGTTAGNRDG